MTSILVEFSRESPYIGLYTPIRDSNRPKKSDRLRTIAIFSRYAHNRESATTCSFWVKLGQKGGKGWKIYPQKWPRIQARMAILAKNGRFSKIAILTIFESQKSDRVCRLSRRSEDPKNGDHSLSLANFRAKNDPKIEISKNLYTRRLKVDFARLVESFLRTLSKMDRFLTPNRSYAGILGGQIEAKNRRVRSVKIRWWSVVRKLLFLLVWANPRLKSTKNELNFIFMSAVGDSPYRDQKFWSKSSKLMIFRAPARLKLPRICPTRAFLPERPGSKLTLFQRHFNQNDAEKVSILSSEGKPASCDQKAPKKAKNP